MSVVSIDICDVEDPNGTTLVTLTDADLVDWWFRAGIGPAELGAGRFVVRKDNVNGQAFNLKGEAHLAKITIPVIDPDPLFAWWVGRGEYRLFEAKGQSGAELLTFSGVGVMDIMRQAVLDYEAHAGGFGTGAGPRPLKGWWIFEDWTPGRIARRLIEEDQASPRSALPFVTHDFTATLDSDGVAWADSMDEDFRPRIKTDFLTVLRSMAQAADFETWMTPDLLLQAFNELGTDRTSATFAADKVRFVRDVNILTRLGRTRFSREKATHALVEGADQTYHWAVQNGWEPPEPIRQIGLDYPDSARTGVLDRAGHKEFQRRTRAQDAIAFEVRPGDDELAGLYLPFVHYRPGDLITLRTGASGREYVNSPQRLTAIEISKAAAVKDGDDDERLRSIKVAIELNATRAITFDGRPAGTARTIAAPHTHPSVLCDAFVPAVPDELLFFYSADGDDDIDWSGISEGPPGADGSTDGYFKSGTPQKYQTSWAVTPGQQIRVEGWIGCTTGSAPGNGFLTLNFFEEAAGTGGGSLPSTPLEENILTPEQPAHEHTVVWDEDPSQHFFAGPFTVPEGAESAALGRIVSAQFDQVSIYLVGSPAQNPGHGTAEEASRCDHSHHWLSVDPPTVDDDTAAGFAVGTVWLQVDDVDAPTAIVDRWYLIDNTAGAAVWEQPPGGGGGGGGHEIQENGTPLDQQDALNFGSGLVASDNPGSSRTDVDLDWAETADITTLAFGDTAAAGSTGEVPPGPHRHGMPANPVVGLAAGLHVDLGDGESVIAVGLKGFIRVPFACTIVGVRLLADVSGSAVIDIWKDTYANFPPTVADTITASAKPTLSSAVKYEDTTLTGWTTALAAGDILAFNVDSCTSIEQLAVELSVTRT